MKKLGLILFMISVSSLAFSQDDSNGFFPKISKKIPSISIKKPPLPKIVTSCIYLPNSKLLSILPNGNMVIALPQDNMPCVVPRYEKTMPVN